jgi:hypothetical protein
MGRKADRRAARVAAAQARDLEWIRRGMADEVTLAHLRRCDEHHLKAVLFRASADAARPMSENHVRGLVCLGALEALARDRMEARE